MRVQDDMRSGMDGHAQGGAREAWLGCRKEGMDSMAMGHSLEIGSAGRRSQFPFACLTMLDVVKEGNNLFRWSEYWLQVLGWSTYYIEEIEEINIWGEYKKIMRGLQSWRRRWWQI
jgi:hypothetical protein